MASGQTLSPKDRDLQPVPLHYLVQVLGRHARDHVATIKVKHGTAYRSRRVTSKTLARKLVRQAFPTPRFSIGRVNVEHVAPGFARAA